MWLIWWNHIKCIQPSTYLLRPWLERNNSTEDLGQLEIMAWVPVLSSCQSINTMFPPWLLGHPPLLIPWLISCSALPVWLMVWPTFQAPRLPLVPRLWQTFSFLALSFCGQISGNKPTLAWLGDLTLYPTSIPGHLPPTLKYTLATLIDLVLG